MKATSGVGWFHWLFPAAGLLCISPAAISAQEISGAARFSTNAADRVACERQLNIIYGAIQNYRSRHDSQYPAKLSNLTPDFIHDSGLLVCPFVRAHGGLRTWKKELRELSSDAYASYGYELAPDTIEYNHWRGLPKKTWQDFKMRVADKVGPVVPIVRCHVHRPWLNLGIDGRIYESGLYWERNFDMDDSLLTVAKLFPGSGRSRPLSAGDFLPRDPRAGVQLLDLTEYYNATLTDSWQGFPGNHLANLPTGVRDFGGTQFDVRGVIQLLGSEIPATFPKRVAGIKVDQKCDRIHFLHAQGFVYQTGTITGLYIIHYTDAHSEEIPLVYGQQIADCWRDPKDSGAPSEAKLVWTGENEAAKAYDKVISLYRFTWTNPRKATPIATITFDTGARADAPFVVAITLE